MLLQLVYGCSRSHDFVSFRPPPCPQWAGCVKLGHLLMLAGILEECTDIRPIFIFGMLNWIVDEMYVPLPEDLKVAHTFRLAEMHPQL